MKPIHYSEILKQSFELTWKNKFLWFFGLCIVMGNVFSSVDISVENSPTGGFLVLKAFQFQTDVPVFLGIAVLGIVMFTFVLKICATAGLIRAVNDVSLFRQLTKTRILVGSMRYFWPLLGIEIGVSIILASMLYVLAVPAVMLFTFKARIFGFVVALCAAVIFIVIAAVAYFLKNFSVMSLVLGNLKLKMAIETGYSIFSKHVKQSILMALAMIGASLGFFILVLSIMLSVIVVSFILSLLAYLLFNVVVVYAISLVALLTLFAIMIAAVSSYVVFVQSSWVIFFKELVDECDTKTVEKEEAAALNEFPNPEAV